MIRTLTRLAVVSIAVALGVATARPAAQAPKPATFAGLVAKLSEPGGDFGGDNLISNEQSYLRVMPALEQAQVKGGAYLGVGPDQNFSYIAQVRPAIAFIVDIRRDNLLLQLLFKAIFAAAPTRVEYLSLLTGRAPPASPETFRDAGIDRIVTYIDRARPMTGPELKALSAKLDASIKATSVPLTAGDVERIAAFHRTFVDAGLSLVFQARGQPPRSYYPTLRMLLLETDPAGRHVSFLGNDPAYEFVRLLEARDLVVPVVGDVSGTQAMRAIAAEMTARALPLSAFYISNVEYYLFADGRFAAFMDNLKRLPGDARSTMIRSVFPSGYRGPLPQSVAGHYSTSLTQPIGKMIADWTAGRYRSYADVVVASSR